MTIPTIWTPKRPRIFFMHIPKTAGMTLRNFLGNQYPVSQRMPANDWLEFLDVDIKDIDKYNLFQGHFTSGIFDLIPKNVKQSYFCGSRLRGQYLT
jgi:hypothetical protein